MELLSRGFRQNSQPLVTCIYIGLLDKNVLIALEVHAHGCYHVQLFFELPLAEPVFVAQSAPYIRIVVNRAESLLVAHLPQRSIVARVHGGSVFHKGETCAVAIPLPARIMANKQIGIRITANSLYLVKC